MPATLRSFASRSPIRGSDAALPEARIEVRERLIDRLLSDASGAVRQDYSNGEFITSSFIVALTFEAACAKRLELEGADPVVHFDPDLTLYWRRGGWQD